MVAELESFLKIHYSIQKIKDVPDSCSTHEFPVFYFDKISENFSQKLKINKPPSCDCLYTCKHKNEVIFIEMRKYANTIKSNRIKCKNYDDFIKVMVGIIAKDEFDKKILYSYITLLSYLGHSSKDKLLGSLLYEPFKEQQIGVRFIIHSDIDSMTYLKWFAIDKTLTKDLRNKIASYTFLKYQPMFVQPDDFAGTVQWLEKTD